MRVSAFENRVLFIYYVPRQRYYDIRCLCKCPFRECYAADEEMQKKANEANWEHEGLQRKDGVCARLIAPSMKCPSFTPPHAASVPLAQNAATHIRTSCGV